MIDIKSLPKNIHLRKGSALDIPKNIKRFRCSFICNVNSSLGWKKYKRKS